jgi:tetratricopeptide (TPR) repeat protein
MQTYNILSISLRAAETATRPFRIIALLSCVAFAMSACKTTRAPDDDISRPPSVQTRPESKETTREPFDREQPMPPQGKMQEDIGTDPAQRKQLVTAMFTRAAALGKEGNLSGAIPVYREIEQLYGDASGDDKTLGAWAIFYQGDLQRQMRNHKAAVAAYERLDQRFGQISDPAVRTIVADALHKKGEAQIEQGDTRAAIATFDEIDRRYAEDRDVGFRLRAVRALFTKGSLLSKQGTGEEPGSELSSTNIRPTGDTAAAVAVFDDIVQRFGRDRDPNIHNIIGGTLLKKSEALRLAGDDQGTISAYSEIVERFGKDDAPVSRVLVATALFRKGLTLGRQEGASSAAIDTFEEVIRRFASDTNPNVRKIVGQANTAKQRLISETVPMHDN